MTTAPAPFVSRGILAEAPQRADGDAAGVATFTAEAIRTSASGLALLCAVDGVGERWIPQSCIDDASEVYEPGHAGKLVIAAWFADKDGLLDAGGSDRKAGTARRDIKPEKPAVELTESERTWLAKVEAADPDKGLMTRPCKALIDLEQRGLVGRTGSGVETVWRKAVQW